MNGTDTTEEIVFNVQYESKGYTNLMKPSMYMSTYQFQMYQSNLDRLVKIKNTTNSQDSVFLDELIKS